MSNTNDDVVAWYERKTESIIRKYGPGPRIHFHTGLVDQNTKPAPDIHGLKRQLVQSQEDLLHEAARFWEAKSHLCGTILDVGCGLGGSSIFLAQEYGAFVHALTNVPGHVPWISLFSNQAGVAERVKPVLGDACAIPGNQIYDAAMAIESSCYLDRAAWFRHLINRVHTGGHLFIADCFTSSDEVSRPFDRYWLTQIGSIREYMSTAEGVGFKVEGLLDLTSRTSRFWELSILYSRRLLRDFDESEQEADRLRRSIKWQIQLLDIWNSGKIMCALLRFVHP